MNKEELEFILQEGEGQFTEFKENFDSKNIAKEMVAFANAEGGKIILGIKDNGEIKGVEISNKLKSQIQDIANNCDPSIRIHLVEKIGSGIKRINEECEKHGNVNFGIESNGYFIAEFKLKKINNGQILTEKQKEIIALIKQNTTLSKQELGVKLGVKLGENEAEILREIVKNKLVTATELSQKIGISTTAIENNLSKLKEKGILKRVGPDKGGYWEVIK